MTGWTYSQKSGELHDPTGTLVATGYAGSEPAVNRPVAQSIENVGPLPRGTYTIGAAYDHPTCGPCSLPLTPDPSNEMFDRSGFLIHGDSIDDPGSASTGCIILPRAVRDAINASDNDQLIVTV